MHKFKLEMLACALIAVIIGLISVKTNLFIYAVATVLGALITWYSIKFPPLTISIFLVAYTLHTTVLASGQTSTKIFYPIYVIMLINAIREIHKNGLARFYRPEMVWYTIFFVLALVSATWSPPNIQLALSQQVFIYCLGLLAALQISKPEHQVFFQRVTIVNALVVSCWTAVNAYQSNFAYRSGVNINQNYIATLICFGMIPAFQLLFINRNKSSVWKIVSFVCVVAGVYANILLISRGVTIALVVSVLLLLLVGKRKLRTLLIVTIPTIFGWLLLRQLPTYQAFLLRFHGSDTSSFDGRLPIWEASWTLFRQSPVLKQLFGHGMGFSQLVANAVNLSLDNVHNVYIQFLLDYGLGGLLSFCILMLLVLWKLLSEKSDTALVGVSNVVFLLCCGITATVTDSFLFWIMFGTTLLVKATHETSEVSELKKTLLSATPTWG